MWDDLEVIGVTEDTVFLFHGSTDLHVDFPLEEVFYALDHGSKGVHLNGVMSFPNAVNKCKATKNI